MRKYYVLVAGMILCSSAVLARDLEVGTIQISGAGQAIYQESNIEQADGVDSDVTQLSMDFDGTYCVLRNIGVGAYISYAESGLEDYEIKSYTFGPLAVYNYSLNETMSLYAKAGAGFLKVDHIGPDVDGWEYRVGGGLRYFLVPDISLDFGLMFEKQSRETDEVEDLEETNLSVQVGLSVYFGGK